VSRSRPSSDGRPPAPSPNRSAGQWPIGVTTSEPSIANRSEHSNVIAETTPSSPRFGAIEKNSGSSRVSSWTSPRPSISRKPKRLSLALNCDEPPEEPVPVKPLIV
jgi:hypothetical protein